MAQDGARGRVDRALIDRDNIVWEESSHDASGSMPCGGGDIGLNVWVENGDLLFYFGQSGAFDENNALLKGGRVRVRLSPNPLAGRLRQELVLHDGSVMVTGWINGVSTTVRVWVDVYRPAVHVEVNGNKALGAEVTYESWRFADRVMEGKANNANSYKWAWRHAPGGQVVTYRDSIHFQDNGVLFYHRNRDSTVFDVTVRQQGLDSVKSLLHDPLAGRMFGGILMGSGLTPGGRVSGRYLDTDFEGWKLVGKALRRREILLVLATTQKTGAEEWMSGLKKMENDVRLQGENARQVTMNWWEAFWKRSFIYIGGDTNTPEWQ